MADKKLKKLPLGISTFSEIIQEDYVYVDKTKLIYELVTGGKYYFLSRPRRFGKSLLVSTLAELFSGKRELFKNLWIHSSDYTWPKHPIIRFDFSAIGHETVQELRQGIFDRLEQLSREYTVDLSGQQTLTGKFQEIIIQLSKINKVVILIDEYDKPILDHIDNIEEAKAQREVLKSLYSVIKASDNYVRFVFLTGVTKFAKASIFSGLNNVRDITLNEQFATLAGCTTDELHTYLDEYVRACARKMDISSQAVYDQLNEYYDGYCFSVNNQRVCNPFSVFNCLMDQRFGYYWFATGTPAFLLHIIRHQTYNLREIEEPVLDEMHLDKIDVERIPLTALLFQTGYLTITHADQKTHKFTLNFPNKEVRNAFISNLADIFVELPPEQTINYARDIAHALQKKNIGSVLELLQDLFNKMPYTTHIKHERDFHFILYCIFKLIGIEVDPEVTTSLGRADLVVTLPKLVYVIELKFNGSAAQALEQIRDKKYYEKYENTDKQIMLIGINFDEPTKTVSLESSGV